MIPERIQALYREAVFKTCVQGTRAGILHGGMFTCHYTDDSGKHCAVGHALTPEMQTRAGVGGVGGVMFLCKSQPDIAEHLGVDPTRNYADEVTQSGTLLLWENLQWAHDGLTDAPRSKHRGQKDLRPWGVSWSAYFWYLARSNAISFGFDIGNYPRHEVQNAQAA